MMAKTTTSIVAITYCGTAWKKPVSIPKDTSSHFRRPPRVMIPTTIPAGMETSRVTMMPSTASSAVKGSLVAMIEETDVL